LVALEIVDRADVDSGHAPAKQASVYERRDDLGLLYRVASVAAVLGGKTSVP
jgi:hypothetical protein